VAQRRQSGRAKTRLDAARSIVDDYRPTEGCPPLSTHSRASTAARGAWLRRFAKAVGEDHAISAAWSELETRCDTSFLIDLLYLFTDRGQVLVDENARAHHLVKSRINQLSRAYWRWNARLDRVIQNTPLLQALGLDSLIVRQARALGQTLVSAEKAAALWGSRKTNPKDWYLYLVANHIKDATGALKVKSIAELVGAADAAHDEEGQVWDDDQIKKRIQRYAKRLKLMLSVTGSSLESSRNGRAHSSHREEDPNPF
jgi:hypothetical protein